MTKSQMGFIPIILAAIIAGGVLLAGGGTYTGVTYYQSNKLIKEADKLIAKGKYADAITKYNKAKKKWRWAKIQTKKSNAEILNKEEDSAKEGEANFGKGEWQKCLEHLGQVTPKYPKYGEIQTRYSDCQKKLDEQNTAETATIEAQKTVVDNPTKTTAKKKTATSATSSTPSASATSQPTTGIPPTIYLPYSTGGNLPSAMTPMGETLFHEKPGNPQGHPGIDFQWENPSGVPTITASMDATITEIKADDFWVGAYAVSTKNGSYGVDYTELGGVSTNLKVGDAVKVGDAIGTPQHPSTNTDFPNFRMIHWQFGTIRDERYGKGVGTRLCPLSYFASSARSAIENLWANTNATELKANAPDICSGDYK